LNMVEQEQTGRKDEEALRQGRKETAAEAIQRDAARAASASSADRSSLTGTESGASAATAPDSRMEGSGIGAGMRGAVSETLQSVGAAGGGAIETTRDVLKGVISATEDVGVGLVGGVRHVAKDVVIGVGDVGGTAVHALTDLLAGVVGGVKTVVSEVLPSSAGRSMRTTSQAEAGYGTAPGRSTEEEARYRAGRTEQARAEEVVH
jgi:hypothetical protein